MNISLCLWVDFADVYRPISPEDFVETRVAAHSPDAQCQDKAAQRKREQWPIRRHGSYLLPSTTTDQSERSHAPCSPAPELSAPGWSWPGGSHLEPVESRSGLGPVTRFLINNRSCLLFAIVRVHRPSLLPLECLSPIVLVQQWLSERDACKRTELYISLSVRYIFCSYLQIFLCFWRFPLPYADLIFLFNTLLDAHPLASKLLLLNTTSYVKNESFVMVIFLL